jgi:hypothetical protein
VSSVWTCPLCLQSVLVVDGRLVPPPDYLAVCKLREHVIGDACVAYHDVAKATQLLRGSFPSAIKRLILDDRRAGVSHALENQNGSLNKSVRDASSTSRGR